MAQTINQLTAASVSKQKKPGMYADGAGLYLQVTSENAKSWIFRYCLRGAAREMGLGSLRKISLAQARAKRSEYHLLLEDHIDPIEHRRARQAQAGLASTKTITFKEAAEKYHAAKRGEWKNPKHAAQWLTTLVTYAYPVIGKLLVRDIDTSLVHQVLEPIWTTKSDTADRVRGRIEKVLDWARVNGYRTGDNPARKRGNLDHLLPDRAKVHRVEHRPAMPYAEIPAFIRQLRQQRGVAARALEFCILTAARTETTVKAKAEEIDRREKLWTPAEETMKGNKAHIVPLCGRAMELAGDATTGLLFPGQQPGRPLSNMAMLKLLERMGRSDVTVHGFRSTFKDWARDRTQFENYVSEAALAHAVADKVEAAYARSAVIAKRRKLMDAWARFCESTPAQAGANVVPMVAR